MNIDQFENISLIVLCGGESKRFDNKIKALQTYQDRTLVSHTINKFAKYFNKIYISVSNSDVLHLVKDDLHNYLTNDILFKISIIKDSQENGHSPLFGILNILKQLKIPSAIVIPIDKPLITINDLIILEKQAFLHNQVLTTFIINKKWITSDFFMIQLNKHEILDDILKLMKGRKRLTDLIRVVPSLRLIQIDKISNFVNVNTPEELLKIESLKEILNFKIIEYFNVFPLMYLKNSEVDGVCHKYEMEILSWINSTMISQIYDHILRDFKKELSFGADDCNLNKFEEYLN